MPHTESAKKRLRQNEERRLRNKARATELKTLKKQIERHLHDGESAQAAELYNRFAQRVDQAASGSTLHKNTAARAKGRVAAKISAAIKNPTPVQVKSKPVKAAKPAVTTTKAN